MEERVSGRAWLAVLALGIGLMLPSIAGGFLLDDLLYLAALDGDLPHKAPSDELFRFFSGDATETASFAKEGLFPWWINDEIRIAFFRPLSALLIRAENSVWPRLSWAHHVHSLAWWAMVLVAVCLLFRRLFPGPVGWLAFLLFAVDESHVFPAAWISNRNALVAVAPSLLALYAHLRWREESWRPGLPLAVFGLALGLLGGETALSIAMFLLAYELFGARDSVRRRLAGLLPTATILVFYVMVRALFDYGASGSGIYVDPVEHPITYSGLAAGRLPALIGAAIAGLSADFWILAARLRPFQIGFGVVAAIVFASLLRSCWSEISDDERRHLRWLLPGGALALLPVAATFPSDRLLLSAAVGYCPAIAIVMRTAWLGFRAGSRRWLAAAGAMLFLVHLVLAPILVVLLQVALHVQGSQTRELAASAPVPEAPDRHAIVLWAPDHVVGLYLPLAMRDAGRSLPGSWRVLSLAPFSHRVTRTDERTLVLEVLGGAMMNGLFEKLYRDESPPFGTGDVLDRGMLRVEILDTTARGPSRVAFEIDRSLDDDSLALLAWMDGELRTVAPPPIGGSVEIKRTLGPAGF